MSPKSGDPPTKSLTSVSVTPPSASVGLGATEQFTATGKYSDNTSADLSSTASWTSATPSVATVSSSGLATAAASGSTTIMASLSGISGTATLNVGTVTRTVTSIAVAPATANISVGATLQFSATATYNDGSIGIVTSTATWTSGTPGVATINSSGLATAVASGSTVITALLSGIKGTATFNVTGATVVVSPSSAVIAPSATQQFSAKVQGVSNASVTWSVDSVAGGNSTDGVITSSGLYTAPAAVGTHTIVATSTADPSLSGSATVTVSNGSQAAVLTYHNDDARDGAFLEEVTLTPSNVNSSQFGKLFSYPVDGQIYAQPLYMPQVTIGGSSHEVVFIATQNNSVYAFDATGAQTTPFWNVNLGAHVSKNSAEGVNPYVGILSTPVIDSTTNTIYVVAEEAGKSTPFWLHALDVTTGGEKFGGPVAVTGTVPGTGQDSSGGNITLETSCYQRMGLALNPVTNAIYISFGNCPHGWVLAYNKTTLQQTAIFNVTPDGGGGGLWSGGAAPAIDDATGDLYLMSGVDAGDQNYPQLLYNDSFLRLNPSDLSVLDFFAPDNNLFLAENDADLGSGANILLPGSSSFPHETIGGGKDGNIFVVNRDDMGGFNSSQNSVIQTVHTGTKQFDNIFSTPVYWNGFVYYHPESDVLHAFSWSSGMLSSQPVSSGTTVYEQHGATASLSANGTTNGIIWDIDNTAYNGTDPSASGPAVLHAYDATIVATELYNSSQAGTRDKAGLALKFIVPTISGGRVYVPTGNELDVYGLLAP
jgi:Big-like domain-containing protein